MAGQDRCSCKRVPGRQPGLHISMPGQLGALRQRVTGPSQVQECFMAAGERKEKQTDAKLETDGHRRRVWE